MKDVSHGIGGRTISFSCGSLWAYTAFKPNVSLWFYVQEDHMLDKYLYLIWNPLKIKIFLLLLQAARLDQVPYPYYVIIILIKICVIHLSNRALYRVIAYKLVYLMIVIEICHSPDISTQVSVQITGSFRVCRTFFKHPMTNFVKRHCMYYIK